MKVSRTLMIRSMSTYKKVAVVGLGLMGHGVAQVTAQSGYQVLAVESNPVALEYGIKRIQGSLSKIIAKDLKSGKFQNEVDSKLKYEEIMSRIKTTSNLADVKDCDLIVEAIAEIEDLKLKFFKDLSVLANPNAVFASNTSSLAITPMATVSGRPDKFVGLHFFNPVQIMKLLEVIRTDKTNDVVFQDMISFGKSIGKTTVSCSDTPGFIVNRLLIPYLSQAMAMVDRKVATISDIDISMQLGAGHPMGPLHLADYVGLDTTFNILSGWKEAYPNEQAFFIPHCLANKVSKGHFGRKSGTGFYNWEGDKVTGPVTSE
eukprot:gene6471-8901_t